MAELFLHEWELWWQSRHSGEKCHLPILRTDWQLLCENSPAWDWIVKITLVRKQLCVQESAIVAFSFYILLWVISQLKCTAKSYLVQSIRTEQTTAFFVRFLFDTTVLHHFEDLMELTHVYSFEQSRGDSFWKAKKKIINATECSISQTSYSTFCNGKDLVYFTGFGITNSSKNLLLSLSTSSADHSPTKRTRKVNELWGGDDGFASSLGKTWSFADVRKTAEHSPQLS